jgi:hypothetical protein
MGIGMVVHARSVLRERDKVRAASRLFRVPITLTVSRGWIHAFTSRLKNKPLLDLVGSVVEDYEFLWDEYYFSTATM